MNATTFEPAGNAHLWVTPCETLAKQRNTPEVELVRD